MKCTFCGKEIEKGCGLTFVYKIGKIVHFCSKKCEKSVLKFDKKARHVRWTEESIKEKEVKKKNA